MKTVTFTEAIRQATQELMARDERVHVFGLGATYPNGCDGTTGGLNEEFPGRVHDTPCSEAAVTGMAVGAAVSGLRPIVHHGRIEFALYAMDAILTQAANWDYMFGGDYPCPLIVRVAIGRQWGNGPQHTRNAAQLFAVPGLTVVCPSNPVAARALLLAAAERNSPTIFLEHRWLYKLRADMPENPIADSSAYLLRVGRDLTIVAAGDMVLESLRAAQQLEQLGISAEVIDLSTLYPLDKKTIRLSVGTTGRLLVVESGTGSYGIASEVIAATHDILGRQYPARRICCPQMPCPTAPRLTEPYYPVDTDIVSVACSMMGRSVPDLRRDRSFEQFHLAPSDNFTDLMLSRESLPA
jgi:pyruvate/2-oxoglutarate/acetoin dehydrogenase E1 component